MGGRASTAVHSRNVRRQPKQFSATVKTMNEKKKRASGGGRKPGVYLPKGEKRVPISFWVTKSTHAELLKTGNISEFCRAAIDEKIKSQKDE